MDSRRIALKETYAVAVGEAVCVAAMLGIYALLGRLEQPVLLGALAGGLIAILNFFFMAVIASLAADRAERQDVEGGKKLMQGSYPIRLLILAVVLFACAKSGFFDLLALVLPLAFVRPVITVAEFFKKKGA